jgi:hypothetical protein
MHSISLPYSVRYAILSLTLSAEQFDYQGCVVRPNSIEQNDWVVRRLQ